VTESVHSKSGLQGGNLQRRRDCPAAIVLARASSVANVAKRSRGPRASSPKRASCATPVWAPMVPARIFLGEVEVHVHYRPRQLRNFERQRFPLSGVVDAHVGRDGYIR
jgi:hypothetical protein